MTTLKFSKLTPKHVYDEIQVFWADDEYGAKTIFTLIEIDDSSTNGKYLGVRVTSDFFKKFLTKVIDLRTIYEQASQNDLFWVNVNPIELPNTVSGNLISEQLIEDWLPLEGYFFEENKQNVFVNLGFKVPESELALKISPEKLISGMKVFIDLFEAMKNDHIKKLENKARDAWKKYTPSFAVYGLSHASFRIDMKSDDSCTEDQNKKTSEVLEDLTYLMSNLKGLSPGKMSNFARDHYSGAVSYSLLKAAGFVLEADAPFYLEWAAGGDSKFEKTVLEKKMAKDIKSTFIGEEVESESEVEFTGELKKVDVRNGTWALSVPTKSKNKKTINGGVSANISLSGLTTNETYNFKCKKTKTYSITKGKYITQICLAKKPKKISNS